VLYDDLGLSPAGRAAAIETSELVTLEQLAQFGADRVLLMLTSGADLAAEWEQLQRSEPWRQTTALHAGRVTPIAYWPWFDYSAFSQEKFLAAVPSIFKM